VFQHAANLVTVGLPLYLSDSFSQYSNQAAQNNLLLLSRIGAILDPFCEALERYLNLPLYFDPRLAVPGIHLFSSEPGAPYPGGVWHTDVFRFEILPIPQDTLSATLLLGESDRQFGISYRNEDGETDFYHSPNAISLINSQVLHRVMPFGEDNEALKRMSIQAHIWIYKEQGIIFW